MSEILNQFGIPVTQHPYTRCTINGEVVPFDWYSRIRPKATSIVTIQAYPLGDAIPGTDLDADTAQQREHRRMALAIASVGIGGLIGQALDNPILGSVIGVLGTILVLQFIPAMEETLDEAFSLSGTTNRVKVNEPVPVLYGTHRVFPPLIARPFTEIVGDDQYLHLMFLMGYGPMVVDELKFGEVSLSDFPEDDILVSITQGQLVDKDISEHFVNVVLEKTPAPKLVLLGPDSITGELLPQTLVTEPQAQAISLDLSFINGLTTDVEMRVRYRQSTGEEGAWTTVNSITNDYYIEQVPANLGEVWDILIALEAELDIIIAAIDPGTVLGSRKVPPQAKFLLDNRWATMEAIAGVIALEDGVGGSSSDARDNLVANAQTLQTLIAGFTEVGQGVPITPFDDDYNNLLIIGRVYAGISRIALEWDQRTRDRANGAHSISISPDWRSYLDAVDHFPGIATALLDTTFEYSDTTTALTRRGVRWTVEPGEYEVEVTRITPDLEDDSEEEDTVTWTALRTIKFTYPLPVEPKVCVVAMRIRATDELQGSLDEFNAVCAKKIRTWNGFSWDAPTVDATPAWVFADILQGSGAKFPVLDSRLDLARLVEWETQTTSLLSDDNQDRVAQEFNGLFTNGQTIFDTLKTVAAVGRARFTMREGQYSVALDAAQTTPVQMFTPRNSSKFRSDKTFRIVPDELRVRFVDSAVGYQANEVIVLNQGIDNEDSPPETYDELELFAVTSAAQAWQLGKYHLNTLSLRPEKYTLTTDMEHLVCELGDMVLVRNDVTLWGLSAGRILSNQDDGGGNLTGFTLDEEVNFGSEDHTIRVRKADNTFVDLPLNGAEQSSSTNIVVLGTPITDDNTINAGDLVAVGIVNEETVELIVKEIRHRGDLSAELTLLDHAPEVHFLDVIPEFDPKITLPNPSIRPVPPEPFIDRVNSGEEYLVRSLDGSLSSQIVVDVNPPIVPQGFAIPTHIQGQFRRGDSAPWTATPNAPISSRSIISFIPVEDKATYNLRIRYVTSAGVTSKWVYETHTVIGKTSPPPSPTGMLVDIPYISWEYLNAPLDLAGFQVRVGDGATVAWETATPLHEGLVSATTFDTNFAGYQLKKFFVKAIDTTGNESTDAAYVLVNLGDVPADNIIVELDEHPTFPGTKILGSVDSSVLETDETGSAVFWNASGATIFYDSNPSSVFWPTVTYENMVYEWEEVIDSTNGPGRMSFNLNVVSDRWILLYRTNANKVLWPYPLSEKFWPSPLTGSLWYDITDWLPWPGSINAAEGDYKFRLEVDGGANQGTVDELTLVMDVEDVEDIIENEIITSGGEALVLTKTFRAIRTVTVNLQNSGGTSVVIVDKALTGPTIKVLDAAGNDIEGTVDAIVRGY